MPEGRPKVVASIEARMGSSRLPGKVLMDVNGKTALDRLVERLKACETIDEIVLATSVASQDDQLEEWAKTAGLKCYRGSEDDVLDRVLKAHEMIGSEVVMEATGDCTLLDPQVVDMGVETYFANSCDIVTNTRKTSYPLGIDVQVFPLSLLKQVSDETQDREDREHVTKYIYDNEDRFRIIHLIAPKRLQRPIWRFMLDYPEDLKFLNEVYRNLEPLYGSVFGIERTIPFLDLHQDIVEINLDAKTKSR